MSEINYNNEKQPQNVLKELKEYILTESNQIPPVVQALLDKWISINSNLIVDRKIVLLAQCMLVESSGEYLGFSDYWEILESLGWQTITVRSKENPKVLNKYFILPHIAKILRKDIPIYSYYLFETKKLIKDDDYLDDGPDGSKDNLKNYILKNGPTASIEMTTLTNWWENKNEYNIFRKY